MQDYVEFSRESSAQDGIVWVIQIDDVKGYVLGSSICLGPNDTGSEIFPNACICLPPNPIKGIQRAVVDSC